MSGSSPLELLNDNLTLTFNFNKYIFSAIYCYDKPFNSSNLTITLFNNNTALDSTISNNTNLKDVMKVVFAGINNIKMTIYKDRVLKGH